ncbi:MAG: magnesium chelatase ATPase subunit I [Acidobacteriota bacterium]
MPILNRVRNNRLLFDMTTPRQSSRHARPRRAIASSEPKVYPFSAIVGQEQMKLALLLSVIEPRLGGVLLMGHRGTGKSTAVRALADLLPPIARVKGCPFGCDPFDLLQLCDSCRLRRQRSRKLPVEHGPIRLVELPLGATEDRVCGSLDIERALVARQKAFEPGLLARAHRGFLYIDEVNLLEDFLVDLLLDVAASGENHVQREGISLRHPARFVLVGSGNPEEGELRPQLLDRFGLFAEIETVQSLADRIQIIEYRNRFEANPVEFRRTMEPQQKELRDRLQSAQQRIQKVELEEQLLTRIAELCARLKTDGHRGELTIARAARALAAITGRSVVEAADVRTVASMALRHRLRKDPLDSVECGLRIDQAFDEVFGESRPQQALG